MTRGYLLAILVLAACTGERGAPASPVIAKSRALADLLCACQTVACADPIDRRWTALTAQIGATQLAETDIDGMAHETQRYLACLAKLPLPPAELLRHARALADQVCQCGGDPACVRPLQDDLDRRLMWTFLPQPKFAPVEQAELTKLLQTFSECALAAGVEPTPK